MNKARSVTYIHLPESAAATPAAATTARSVHFLARLSSVVALAGREFFRTEGEI